MSRFNNGVLYTTGFYLWLVQEKEQKALQVGSWSKADRDFCADIRKRYRHAFVDRPEPKIKVFEDVLRLKPIALAIRAAFGPASDLEGAA
jgi:hypothetical protein